jgi:UPF0755 protein
MAKKFKTKSSLLTGIIFFISLILISISAILFWPQHNPHKIIKITVESGSTLKNISNLLANKNIISNKNIFSLAVMIMGKEKELPTGTFRIVNAKSNYSIIQQLVYGAPEIKKVRILEGWNVNQIADHLSITMGFDSLALVKLIENEKFISKHGINGRSLEGYLSPDTYFFFEGESPESVIAQLIKEYKTFWNTNNYKRAKELSLTEHEVVTLASIIEGEAIYDSERSKISAVYHNRLKINMKLQADPTIQYIIPDSPRRLLNRDLRIKSPYNTYLNKGLPPGPINCPGKESIKAALYPEQNDFIYFVATGDGYHTFSTNENDHNRAKQKLQKLRREHRKKRKK